MGNNGVLLGEYHLTLDDKGRLSIPAALRHELQKLHAADDVTLVVTKFFDDCLVLYPKPEWSKIDQQLLELPNEADARAFVRHFYASANMCGLDRQGRILISPKLRTYAAIDLEAVLIGVGRKLELWSPSRWGTYEAAAEPHFEAHDYIRNLRL